MDDLPIFFYGTLRDARILSVVLGRTVPEDALIPAELKGFQCFRRAGEGFPIITPAPDALLQGVLLPAPDAGELARLTFYEDEDDFHLADVLVTVQGAPERARIFMPRDGDPTDEVWRFEDWDENARRIVMECAVEIMDLYAQDVDWSDDLLWPGIKGRALARAAAAVAPSPAGLVHMGDDPVLQIGLSRPYASFFGVEEHRISHRLHGGGWSREIKRTAFVSGDAVTLTPYDPRTDQVLLITQFRAGPHARGDANPWPMEVIAGRIDAAESPEQTARREALEESGLTIGRMEKVAGYYPSPGIAAEFVHTFVGQADLSEAGGVHGLETESEDILTAVWPLDRAVAAVAGGAANTSPTVISLLWLALNRDRLRRDWI